MGRLRVGCTGHVFSISAPHRVPSHLLWSQSLLHPLVLDAGDLVEEAVAVELEALVELAVRQPLPGDEGEAGLSRQGLGGTQGLARGSSPVAATGIAGVGPGLLVVLGAGTIPAALSSRGRLAAVRRPRGGIEPVAPSMTLYHGSRHGVLTP